MHDPERAPEAHDAGAIYSETAVRYTEAIGTEISVAVDGPEECAALDDFAGEFTGESGPVADVGCGPGRAAAYLTARGVKVVGFDIAPGMVAAARTAHPNIRFELGTLTSLPVDDHALAGAVCWYSIIHTPLDKLEAAWAELRRVLRPGGPLLLAFQAGDGERSERPAPAGASGTTSRMMVSYRHGPGQVAAALLAAGFEVDWTHERPAIATAAHETSPQAMVRARAIGHAV